MADAESNIRLGIDTSDALASLKALQRQVSLFQRQMVQSSASNAASAKKLQQGLIDDINATGKFSASIKNIRNTTESFTNALEKNKLSLGQYFKYGASQAGIFRNKFSTEFATIDKVARERVKDLQTQYISLGRDASGALKSIAVRPLTLDMDNLGTRTAIAAQRQQIFNQLLRQGSTNLLNFGKNTQWAGRQLMVGFTIPLSIFGSQAAKSFMQLEQQAIRFRRVYGDAMTTASQTEEALDSIRELATEFTKYGVEIEKTLELAADAAQMGLQGADLRAQVSEATRLAVLGEVEQQEALKTSVAITNTFGTATEDLANKINFLNIVENETMTAISDLTIAIPKAGPVVRQLGGDVEDLAFFLTAMKEGGINASEGANALKSGLASIINPTQQSIDLLRRFNINIEQIRDMNRGDIKGLIIELGQALDTLEPTQRAQAIEQLFGKFQFARVSTLFKNVIEEGTQAQRVLELTGATNAELAALSNRELRRVEESTTFRFKSAVEQFQAAIAPIGEEFLKLVTPLIEFGTKVANAFNNLSDNAKGFVTGLTLLLGAIGPIALMTFGLLANGVANIIKGFAAVQGIFLKTGRQSNILGEQIDYMTQEQLQAEAVASSLDQTHSRLIQTFTSEAAAVKKLGDVYLQAWKKQQQFDTGRRVAKQTGFNPGSLKLAGGIVSVPGPKGAGDVMPAMLSPGEAVIPAEMAKKYAPLISGMISDSIPGFVKGKTDYPKVQIGGSFEAGHFVAAQMIPIQEALDMLKQSGKENTKIYQNLQKAMDAGVTEVKAFTNEVVAMSKPLNEALKSGSAPMSMIRGEMTGPKAADMHIELERQLGRLGLDKSGITSRVSKINAAIQKKLDQFGDVTEMTTEQLEQLISDAYDDVAKTDKEVRAARKEMQRITTIKDPIDRIKGGQDRQAVNKESYTQQRNVYARTATRSGEYGAFGGFGTDAQMAKALGLKNGREIKALVDQMTAEQQQTLASLKKSAKRTKDGSVDYSEFATSFLEFAGLNNKNVDAQKVAAETIAKKQAELNKMLQGSGIRATIDKRGSTRYFDESGRRVSEKQAIEALQKHTAAINQDTAAEKQNTAAIAQDTVVEKTNTAAKAQGRFASVVSRATNNLSSLSFALTSVAGAGMFMEGAIGEASSKLFGITSAMTALIMVTELLTKVKIKEIATAAAGRFNIGMRAANVKSLRATGAVAGIIPRLAAGFATMLGPIGLVVAGLAALGGIVALIIKIENDRKKNINELGDAAYMTAEKIKSAGDLLGVDLKTSQFSEGIVAGTASSSSNEQAAAIQALRSNETFLKDYASEIEALEGATQAEAQTIIESIALGLTSAGADAAAVNTFVKALAQEAGQTKLNLNFGEINISKDVASQAAKVTKIIQKTVSEGLGTENQRQLNLAIGVQAQNFQALRDGLRNGVIDSNEFYSGMDAALGVFEELTDPELAQSLPRLVEQLGLEDSLEKISSFNDQILLLRAIAEGIDVSQPVLDLLSADANDVEIIRAQRLAREGLADAVGVHAANQEEVNEQEEIAAALNAEIQDANASLQERTTALQNQTAAYAVLIENGYDAETAFELAGDAALAAGINAAIGAGLGSAEWEGLIENIEAFLEAQENAPKAPTSGGGQKSVYQQAIDSLKEQRDQVSNNISAFNKLRNAGVEINDAMKIAEDSTLAAALATTKVGTDKWKTLLDTVKKLNNELRSQEIRQLLLEGKQSKAVAQNQITVSSALSSLGYTYEQLQQVLSNDTLTSALADDLEDGKINSQELRWALAQIKQMEKLEIELNMTTPEGAEKEFDKLYDQAVQYLQAKQTKIELDFKLATADDQDIVEKAQDLIASIQYEIDDYEAGLEEIQDQEEVINDRYDDRVKALDEVQKINDKIAKQQKSQLSVATALAEGDIAAAARAIQEKQAQDAEDAINAQKEALQASRERELARITASSGMSREQIEEKIKDLKKEIFDIEEATLEPAQERIRLLDIERREANQLVEEQIAKWDRLNNEIDLAKLTDEQLAALYAQADVIKDMLVNWDRIEDKTATLTVIKKTLDGASSGGSTGGGGGSSSGSGGSGSGGTSSSSSGGPVIADITPAELENAVASATTNAQKTNPGVSAAVATSIVDKVASTVAGKMVGVIDKATGKLTTSADTAEKKISATKPVIIQNGGNITVGKTSSAFDIAKKNLLAGSVASKYSPSAGEANRFAQLASKPGSSVKSIGAGSMFAMSGGGMVPRYMAAGGIFKSMGTDTVPAMLTPGEFVIRRRAVQNFGLENLKSINNSSASAGDSVYNYSLNVNVKSDANPDEIARAVMTNIKRVESQRVRGSRL